MSTWPKTSHGARWASTGMPSGPGLLLRCRARVALCMSDNVSGDPIAVAAQANPGQPRPIQANPTEALRQGGTHIPNSPHMLGRRYVCKHSTPSGSRPIHSFGLGISGPDATHRLTLGLRRLHAEGAPHLLPQNPTSQSLTILPVQFTCTLPKHDCSKVSCCSISPHAWGLCNSPSLQSSQSKAPIQLA